MSGERIRLVDLLPDHCLRTYGTAPCTASLATAPRKCFNTRATCQDPTNYRSRGFTGSPAGLLATGSTVTLPDGFTLDAWVQVGGPVGSGDILGVVGAGTVTFRVDAGVFGLKQGAATVALPTPPTEYFRLRLVHDVAAGEIVAYYNSRAVGSIAVTATPFTGNAILDGALAPLFCQGFKAWAGGAVMRPDVIEFLPSPGLLHHWAFTEASGATVVDRKGGPSLTTAGALTWSDGESRSVNTQRFGRQQEGLPRGVNIIPSVESTTLTPMRLNLGGVDASGSAVSFGAEATVTFADHPHHDRGVDPYQRERVTGAAQADAIGYDPNEKGTYWTKFFARNPYYEGRPVIIRDGLVGDVLGDMQAREYIVDALAFGTRDVVQMKAVDILRRVDLDKATAPRQSHGQLIAAITNVSASCILQPAGIGNAEYPASGHYTIGDEAGAFTRVGDVVTFVQRGILGSVTDDHDAGDTFQLAWYPQGEATPDVANELLTGFGGIPTSYVDLQDWQERSTRWLGVYLVTRFVGKPTPVLRLFSELLQQASCYAGYDDVDRQILFDQIRPLLSGDVVYYLTDDDAFARNQTALTDKPEQRLAAVRISFGKRTPLADAKQSNYRTTLGFIDGAALSPEEYGGGRTLEMFADWLDAGDARDLGYRLLVRFRDTPKRVLFRAPVTFDAVKPGAVVALTTRRRTNAIGDPAPAVLYQIIERNDEPGSLKFLAQDFPFSFRYGGEISPNDAPDYDVATEAERAQYAYITDEAGMNPDGSVGHVIL